MEQSSLVGAVLVTHANLGEVLVETAHAIVGKVEHILSVSVAWGDPLEEAEKRIQAALKKVDQGSGVLILTDMFGGTPSNISLSFLEEDRVEVISGVNLAMVIKIANQGSETLSDLAQAVREHGIQQISVASALLAE